MSLSNPFPVLPVKVNNYVLEKLIGRGGFGYVYLATSTLYQCKFAVKVGIITENNLEKRIKIKKSFECEFNALKKLDHPNIIRLYDYFDKDDLVFLVFEYCPNGSLEDYIKGSSEIPIHDPSNKQLPSLYNKNNANNKINSQSNMNFSFIYSMADKFRIAIDIMKGVEYCHQNNFAHRDIKTANILFDESGRPKIADFGLAQFVTNEELMKAHEGTAYYAAPEIYKKADYDPYKADIWALGVLLYRFFTFNYPYKANDMKMLSKVIKEGNINYQALCRIPAMKSIIQKMLIVNPQSRISLEDAIAQVQGSLSQFSIARASSLPDKITLKLKKAFVTPSTQRVSNRVPYKSFGLPVVGISKSFSRGSPPVSWQTC